MKKLLSLIIILFLGLVLNAQTEKYIVLKVKGKILLKKNNKELKPKDEINSNDEIIFTTQDAVAALHSPQKGRFTLRAQTDNKTKSGFLALVKNSLTPASERLSSKRSKTKSFDETIDSTLCIISQAKYKLTDEYPVDENNYFILKPLDKKAKPIKLNIVDGYLVIESKSLKPNKSYFTKFDLIYKSKTDEKLLKNMAISIIKEQEVKKDLNAYIKVLQNDGYDNKKIKDAILAYLFDMYGKFNDYEINNWLKTNFNF